MKKPRNRKKKKETEASQLKETKTHIPSRKICSEGAAKKN